MKRASARFVLPAMKKTVAIGLASAAFLAALVAATGLIQRATPEPQPQPEPPARPEPAKPPAPSLEISLMMQRGAQEAAARAAETADPGAAATSQIAAAAEELHSVDAETRAGAGEQLAAYPSPRSEQLLVEALQTDLEPQVRATAAASLTQIRRPKPATVAILIRSLEDGSEEVQQAALDTLADHIQRLDSDSKEHRKLLASLRKTLASKKLAPDVRDDLKMLLEDQNPG